MQQLTTMGPATEPAGDAVPAPGRQLRDPGLGVVLRLVRAQSELRVQVLGGQMPVRLALYVDGDLGGSLDVSRPAGRCGGQGAFVLGDLAVGRHAVTVRAVDATGRWGGASMVVSVPGPADHGAEPARAARARTGGKPIVESARPLHTRLHSGP